jgi:hypothetical protein
MKVYRFAVQAGYEWVVADTHADFEVFRGFDGTSRRVAWSPIRVRLVRQLDERGKPLAESDVPWLGEHAPVMRPRAVTVLRDVLAGDGELLPLECDEAELSVLNVLRVIDALDVSRSDVVRFPSTGRIMTVQSHEFRAERLAGARVFKVPELLRTEAFVTDEVVELVESSGLKGVGFRLLWDERAPREVRR